MKRDVLIATYTNTYKAALHGCNDTNTGQLAYVQTRLRTNSPTICQLAYVGEFTQVMYHYTISGTHHALYIQYNLQFFSLEAYVAYQNNNFF